MIGYLRGKVITKRERSIILDVHGVGYKVTILTEAIAKLSEGDELSLWTHLAVREDALDLYGFGSEEELDFFRLLNTVSGIGPKTALGVLEVAPIPSIRKAIVTGDTSHLIKISGVGSKMANKIVLELKGKAGKEEAGESGLKEEVEALEALKSLGYAHKEAREALKRVSSGVSSTGDRIKEALKILGS
jgi:holliday junction DNA helicase RuvA